jgi:hypothetical protein
MTDQTETQENPSGAYDILRKRLDGLSVNLGKRLAALNEKRVNTFGSSEMTVIGRTRIRTENNCVPRDIVDVGKRLLFGYNVFVGMRPEIVVGDVFSLHDVVEGEDELELPQVPVEQCFLSDPRFVSDFKELYRYYKEARLARLRNVTGKKLAVFQTGRTLADAKVFRWQFGADKEMRYEDNRGERDNVYPPSHEFEWQTATRDDHITSGSDPHVSILNEVFVETIKGDLTIKIENNTESGAGIYAEPVEDPNQALADAQIQYAKLGILILLKIRPYREKDWRYLVFNTRLKSAVRIDAIGTACVALPDDHGIIFPGGYYLQSGDTKQFEGDDLEHMSYVRHIRAPNGEDVLYVFQHEVQGKMVLFCYNMIRREVQTPIVCHGYSIFGDGRMIVFRADSDEPARVHPMQIWQTPFLDDEHAAKQPTDGSYLAKVGNADLVRGISDAYSVKKLLDDAAPKMVTYETLIGGTQRLLDAYHWLDHSETGKLKDLFHEVLQNAELIIDEFDKVQALRQQAESSLADAEQAQKELFLDMRPERWQTVQEFVERLTLLRKQRGTLITLKEIRYMDVERVAELEQAVVEQFDTLSSATVDFLLDEKALHPYHTDLDNNLIEIEQVEKSQDIKPLDEALTTTSEGLDLLNEILGELQVEDASARTQILENIAEVYAKLNRARAELQLRRKSLRSNEAVGEFAAQFKLFSQSVSGALNLADTPEKTDEQLSRLMLQLEDLEAKFSEFDEFILQITDKRDEVYSAFEARKQQLQEDRQRRALHMSQAAGRILQTIQRRAAQLQDADAQNAFFAADSMVLKARDFIAKLYELGDSVKAGDLESKLKNLRDQAGRELRDRQEIFSDGGAIIKLGKHQFSVNTQELDLSLVPYRQDDETHLAVHLSGTDLFQIIDDPTLNALRGYWEQSLVSETPQVYRAEYLAADILQQAKQDAALLAELRAAAIDGKLIDSVRRFAAERYNEGYERGVHDHDTALLLEKLLELDANAGLLRYAPDTRALAQLFWAFYPNRDDCQRWQTLARSLTQMQQLFGGGWREFKAQLETELENNLNDWLRSTRLGAAYFDEDTLPSTSSGNGDAAYFDEDTLPSTSSGNGDKAAPRRVLRDISSYLLAELQQDNLSFTTSAAAMQLAEGFAQHLDEHGQRARFAKDVQALENQLGAQLGLVQGWLAGYAADKAELQHYLLEGAGVVLTELG